MVEAHVHVYVSLKRDEDGYPPFEVEEVDAVREGPGRCRILGAPVFLYGMAPGDVVKVVKVEGEGDQLWVTEVLEPSDNWLARVSTHGECTDEDAVTLFRSLGCDANATPFGLVTVVVPPSVEPGPVLQVLRDGQDRDHHWYFDLGVGPPEKNDQAAGGDSG